MLELEFNNKTLVLSIIALKSINYFSILVTNLLLLKLGIKHAYSYIQVVFLRNILEQKLAIKNDIWISPISFLSCRKSE